MSAPSGLRQRVPTAIVLAALLLLDLFALPPIATLLLIAAVLIGGAWEWSAFVHASPRVRALYVLVVALAVVACDPVRVDPDALQKLLWCAAIWSRPATTVTRKARPRRIALAGWSRSTPMTRPRCPSSAPRWAASRARARR